MQPGRSLRRPKRSLRDRRHVVFDFRITTFMDSSGIGIITRRFRQVQTRGGSVGVINVNGRIDRILLMSGIYRIAVKLDGGLKDA